MAKVPLQETKTKKRFYLPWPWSLLVYIALAVALRIFSIPFILLILWWNKKQQPDGPAEGYCLQRTRGRLIQLVWAAILLLAGAGCAVYAVVQWGEDRTDWTYLNYLKLAGSGLLAVIGVLLAVYLAYTGLRDAMCPEKSRLARSIRLQLPYPDEAPPVRELFAMVDEDLRKNGQWFGKLGVGREWVLGDEVSSISRIRGVFGRDELQSTHNSQGTRTTRIVQLYIVDDRQQQQVTDLRTPKELAGAMECLQQRAPGAVFGVYDAKEHKELLYAKEEAWYDIERAYRQRKEAAAAWEKREEERLGHGQVLTLPDGSVTSRITGDSLSRLLHQCRRDGETRSFQLVPGVPFQQEGRTFCRLICSPGSGQETVQIWLEETSGAGWHCRVSAGEAEAILRDWLWGRIPTLRGWTPLGAAAWNV